MNTQKSPSYETIVGYNSTRQNGPTETVERLNRAYPLTDVTESRMI